MSHRCIFCLRSDRSFTSKAHVLPESAGNENLVLPWGYECDECNEEFSIVEEQVLRNFPGQLFRVAFVYRTKRGIPPTAKIKGGKLTRVDSSERPTVQIKQYARNPYSQQSNFEQGRTVLHWEGPPFSAPKISAFLAKVSLEYFCLLGHDVYAHEYDNLRSCAKSHGTTPFIPFFIGLHAEPTQRLEVIDGNKKISDQFRPVWIKFPGFSGIIPTNNFANDSMDILKSFIHEKVSENLLFITDPNWSKPMKVNLTLTEAQRPVAVKS